MFEQNPEFESLIAEARRLHGGVTYGAGLSMLDQVMGTARLVDAHGTHDHGTAVKAALLHKCWEVKRLAEGVAPLTHDQIRAMAGDEVLRVVSELGSEPEEDAAKSKDDIWREKSDWARALSMEAQEILLAEKIMNFETSRDRPNPKWPLTRHEEYYRTRMIMVEALKEANPALYDIAVRVRDEGMHKIRDMIARQSSPTPQEPPAP